MRRMARYPTLYFRTAISMVSKLALLNHFFGMACSLLRERSVGASCDCA